MLVHICTITFAGPTSYFITQFKTYLEFYNCKFWEVLVNNLKQSGWITNKFIHTNQYGILKLVESSYFTGRIFFYFLELRLFQYYKKETFFDITELKKKWIERMFCDNYKVCKNEDHFSCWIRMYSLPSK